MNTQMCKNSVVPETFEDQEAKAPARGGVGHSSYSKDIVGMCVTWTILLGLTLRVLDLIADSNLSLLYCCYVDLILLL